MSKLFFDHLLELEKVEAEIKKVAKTREEKEELWALVDEIVHHKVMGCILDQLPRGHHEEFLAMFHKSPHDEELLFGYLEEKTGKDTRGTIEQEIKKVSDEILQELSP